MAGVAGVSPEAGDHELAAAIATRAGEMLVALRSSLGHADPSLLGAEGDRRSHALVAELLAEVRPRDAVLSEEGADDARRLSSPRVWIVDPLDGTLEYSEVDRRDWAVHVALWADGELAVGAVALPALGVTLATGGPQLLEPPPRSRRLVVSRTRPPGFVDAVARALDLEPLAMGSVGAKVMSVVRGEADAYVHAGGQYEWDSAAPVAVARSHGLHASRVDGTPLVYNRPDPLLPDLVVCRPELADEVVAAIARATGPRSPQSD